jgi:hypothetical protein
MITEPEGEAPAGLTTDTVAGLRHTRVLGRDDIYSFARHARGALSCLVRAPADERTPATLDGGP